MESLDTFRTVSFAADFASERLPPVTVSGGDFKGRMFRLSLTDGGQPTQAEGVQCRLGWNADPGEALGSYVEAARVDGTATATWEVEAPSSMLAQPRCKAAWMLYTAGTANVLCTLAFDVTVERPVVDTGSAEGEDLVDRLWTAIDTMEQATDNANAATESAHKAADAAAEAAAKALSQATGNVLTAEASGELVNVDDAYPGPLLETKVYGRSEQVTTTGKNLLQTDDVVGHTATGVGITPITLTAGTYTTSFKTSAGSTDIGFNLAFNDSNKSSVKVVGASSSSASQPAVKTFEISADEAARIVSYSVVWYSGLVNKATIEAFQLELGPTATAYEPYSGGVASPSPEWPQPIDSVSSAEVVTAGYNLIKPRVSSGTTNGVSYSLNADGSMKFSGTASASGGIFDLYSSDPVPVDCTLSYSGLIAQVTDASGKTSYLWQTPSAIPAGARVDQMYLTLSAGGSYEHTARVQLEPGPAITTYRPPADVTHYHLDLQGHELRSLPDGTRDELVVNADGSYGIVQRVGHVEYDGSSDEGWSLEVAAGFRGTLPSYARPTGNNITKGPSRCNALANAQSYYPEWFNSSVDGYAIPGMLIQSNFVYVRIQASTGISALADFVSWLAANPVTVDYALADETYVPLGTLDPAPSWPDVGVNNAWTVTDLPTETGVGYVQSVQVVHDRQEARIAALETAIATLEA